jgi:hypothetical protein
MPGGKATVVALDAGNRISHQTVTLGTVAENTVEIAGGLADGQVVVTGSAAGLNDGDVVSPLPAPGNGR